MPELNTTPETTPETVTCYDCGGDVPLSECGVIGGVRVCDRRFADNYVSCADCGADVYNDDSYYVEDLDRYVCAGCRMNYRRCEGCDQILSDEAYTDESDEYCRDCSDSEQPTPSLPYQYSTTAELQSTEKGKIITSPRKFGVELECLYKKADSKQRLSEKLIAGWGYTNDGSIRKSKDALSGAELVSPVMSGKAGEKEIKTLGDNAYKCDFFVNDSCGLHVHLEALDYKRNPEADEELPTPTHTMYVVKNSLGDVMNEYSFPPELDSPDWTVEVVERPIENRKIARNRGQEFRKLRDLWYVYLAFDDVFRAMMPLSRRNNNFCKASSALYSLDQVRDLQDFSELEVLWYKIDRRRKIETQILEAENRKNDKDGSRYTGFNLEPLLRNNSNTIEFRYHSPTLNAEKILRWTDIHQTILDKVSSNNIDEDTINHIVVSETNLIRKARAMCALFGIKPKTEAYIVERIRKFNDLEEARDEEVERSELGRPAQRSDMPRMNRARTTLDPIQLRNRFMFAISDEVQTIPEGIVDRINSMNNPFN